MAIVSWPDGAASRAAGVVLLWLALPAAARADTIFMAQCAACHGAAAEGNEALAVPALAGQDGAYLARQVANFLSGARAFPPENAAAATMLERLRGLRPGQRAEAIAAAAAMRPGQAVTAPHAGAAMRNLTSECTSCHGADLRGVPALAAPGLAGQNRAYLVAQLAAFRAGRRGMAPGDKYGRQMRAMALTIPGDDAVGIIAGTIAIKER